MKKQSGMGLVGAIFILVIVSLLGQYLINISGSQRQIALLSLQSARAYHAASSELDWAIASVMQNNTCPTEFPKDFNLIANFNVTLRCDLSGTFNENNTVTTIFTLTAYARYHDSNDPSHVSRKLRAVINRPAASN